MGISRHGGVCGRFDACNVMETFMLEYAKPSYEILSKSQTIVRKEFLL